MDSSLMFPMQWKCALPDFLKLQNPVMKDPMNFNNLSPVYLGILMI